MGNAVTLSILRKKDIYSFQLTHSTSSRLMPAHGIWMPHMLHGVTVPDRRLHEQVAQAIDEAAAVLRILYGPVERSIAQGAASANNRLEQLGRVMFNMLLPPAIQSELQREPNIPLIIATNDEVLPWELLHDGSHFLCLRRPLSRQLITDIPPINKPFSTQDDHSFLFITDPTGDLPEARQEVEQLLNMFDAVPNINAKVLGVQATRWHVLQALSSGQYDLIHYSGHAQPGSLLLADGELTSDEIRNALHGRPLIFLNACQSSAISPTVEPESAEVFFPYAGGTTHSLATAFILGGALGFIGTLWPVFDTGSREFAQWFYALLLNGETLSESIRHARAYRWETQPHDPIWASYVFYGDPQLCILNPERRELRPLTVVSAQLSGLVQLYSTMSLERAAEIEYQLVDGLTHLARRYGGEVISNHANTVAIRFGLPQAFEDNAERALHTAVDALTLVNMVNDGYHLPLSEQIGICFGVSTGQVHSRRIGVADNVQYQTTGNIGVGAARLAEQAIDGQILLDEVTYRQTQSAFSLQLIDGGAAIENVRADNIYQVVGLSVPGEVPHQGQTHAMIGRDSELTQLHGWWRQAMAGQGCLIGLSGAVGIGKTSLIQAFQQTLMDQEHQWVATTCYAYQQDYPYGLLAQIIQGVAAIDMNDDTEARRRKLEQLLFTTVPTLDRSASSHESSQHGHDDNQIQEALALLGTVLNLNYTTPTIDNLEPEMRRKRLSRLLLLLLAAHARRHPLVIAIDDLQWIDEASLAVLETISEVVGQMHLLVLAAYRTGRTYRWLHSDSYRPLILTELTGQAREALLAKVLDTPTAPPKLGDHIFRYTGGNPLFIAEIIRSLQAHEILVHIDNKWQLTADLDTVPLSEKIELVIQARIDRLSESNRETLEQASIIGQEFDEQILAQIQDDPARTQLARNLTSLLQRDFIRSSLSFSSSHVFTHGLIHQTVYANIWTKTRRVLHRLVAQVIERLQGENESNSLAYHYYHSDDRVNALRHCLRAAKNAADTWSNQTAITWYGRVLEIVQSFVDESPTPDEEARGLSQSQLLRWHIEAFTGRGTVLSAIGHNDEALTDYQEALALTTTEMAATVETIPAMRVDLFRRLVIAYHDRGELEVAWQMLEQGLALQTDRLLPEVGRLHLWRGMLLVRRGELMDGLAACQNGIELLEQTNEQRDLAQAYNLQGIIYRNLGDSRQASLAHNRSIELYQGTNYLAGLERAYSNLGCVYQDLSRWDDALHYFQQSAQLSEQTGEEWRRAAAVINLGEIYLRQGALDRAIAANRQAETIAERFGFTEALAIALMNLGGCYLKQEDFTVATELLQRSRQIFEEIGADVHLSEVLRYQAELNLNQNEMVDALALAQQALHLAERLGHKLNQGQAHRLLGQVFQQLEQPDQAASHLQQSLSIVTEQNSHYERGLTLLRLALFHTAQATQQINDETLNKQADEACKEAIEIFEAVGAAFDLESAVKAWQTIQQMRK